MPASDYASLYQSAGQQYNVDPRLLQAIVATESGGDPAAVSSAGAEGPAQLMPATARALGVTDPTDPKQAIPAAARLLSENLDRYGSPEAAVMAYHGGTDQSAWGPKTQDYLRKVTAAYQGAAKVSDPFSDLLTAVGSAPATQAAAASEMPTPPASASQGAPAAPASDPFAQLLAVLPKDGETKAAAPAATDAPTPDDIISQAKAIGGGQHIPSREEAAQMAGDLAAIAQRNQAKNPPPEVRRNAGVFNGLTNFGNSYLLGAGVPIMAAANATKETIGDVANGMPIGNALTDLASNYDQAKAIYGSAKSQYQASHPVAAPLTQAAGNIAGTVPLMMMGGAALGGAGDALTGTVPSAAPVVDFLSGATQGNRLLKYGSQAANGALQGAASSGLTAGDSDESIGAQLVNGGIAGAIAGPALGAVSDIGSGIKNALAGGGVNAETARLAGAAMNKFGIPIRGGQISGSPIVRYTDSALTALPFTGYAGKQEAARDAFTRAVSRTFGEDTRAITQDTMQAAKTRIGGMFDKVAAGTTIDADPQFVNDLTRIESDATQVLSGSEMTPIHKQLDNILSKVGAAGKIDGDAYQALTRKGAPLDRAMSSSDPNVKYYAGQVRSALDDALERSASPDMLETLRDARSQYKNMKTIEDLAEKSADGRMSPALLLGQVRKSFGNYAYRGAGDLGELAQIGQRFLKEPPNSGTATRNLIHAGLAGAGTLGETALFLHDPSTAMIAAGVGGASALSGAALGKLLDNRIYRNALLRSATKTGQPPATSAARKFAPSAAGAALNAYYGNLLSAPAQ